jgi:hypothetical protein
MSKILDEQDMAEPKNDDLGRRPRHFVMQRHVHNDSLSGSSIIQLYR